MFSPSYPRNQFAPMMQTGYSPIDKLINSLVPGRCDSSSKSILLKQTHYIKQYIWHLLSGEIALRRIPQNLANEKATSVPWGNEP